MVGIRWIHFYFLWSTRMWKLLGGSIYQSSRGTRTFVESKIWYEVIHPHFLSVRIFHQGT